MKEKKENHIILLRGSMLLLNFLAVSAICIFIVTTTRNLLYNYEARSFLENVKAIPQNPHRNMWCCIIMMGILYITFGLRNYCSNLQNSQIIATLVVDIIVSIGIIFLMDFNYNGLIFFVFAEIIYYIIETKYQMFFVTLATAGYLIMDYEMLSIHIPLYNLADYIQCYPVTEQQYMFGLLYILRSLNIVLFILFCVSIMSIQRGTIEEVSKLYKELQATNEQLEKYANMAESMAQTKERNRLAREIHDTLGHTLTGITTGLDACLTLIEVSPEQTKKQLQLLARVSREGVKEVRRSVNELRPDSLERLSLEMAIREMIRDMSQVSNVKIYFETNENNLKFDEDEENTIYRVIQEGITNAVRHGRAKQIWITLKRENSRLYLIVKDNGIGCKDIKSGFGTRHIKERIEMLGGTVDFEGTDGFTVIACIPIRWGETYD